MPMSIFGYSIFFINPPTRVINFGFSIIMTTRTGASITNLLKLTILSKVRWATLSFIAGSSTTRNVQGWELLAEGANRAASRQRSSLSFLTDSDEYLLTLCLIFIKSRNFNLIIYGPTLFRRVKRAGDSQPLGQPE